MNNYRILIVEDSKNLGLLYKQEIEDCGYDVDIGSSVNEAILLLNQHHYDLVILEIVLLMNEGYNPPIILEQFRSMALVVINTTYQLLKNNQNLYSYPYVNKSSNISVLKKKIKHLLDNIPKVNISNIF